MGMSDEEFEHSGQAPGDGIEDDDSGYFRKSFTIKRGALSVTGWRSAYSGDHLFFERREVEFLVRDNNTKMAYAKFVEWRARNSSLEWENFTFDADESSAVELDCAELLQQYWDVDEWPFEYGDLVIFDRLSIPKPHPDIWPCLNAGIERQFKKSGSLMVLKAFPLEWEGEGETDVNLVFEHRREAMKRLYARRLGVASFQGGGNEDWMWKPLGYCRQPRNEPVEDFVAPQSQFSR